MKKKIQSYKNSVIKASIVSFLYALYIRVECTICTLKNAHCCLIHNVKAYANIFADTQS